MRIRKNAKTSAFLHTSSNLASDNNNYQTTTTLCLLNQSPWDIITFPSPLSSSPPIHLFDDFVTRYNVNAAANWSSPDSSRPIQSVITSKNNSYECEYDIVHENVDEKIRNYESYRKEDKLGFMKGCVKKDDNVVDIQNDAVWSTRKKAQPVTNPRGTKKRAVAITPKKQNEFYYYSGFGPSWGKRRGELGDKCTTFNACDTTVSNTSVFESYMDVEEDQKRAEPATTTMMKTVWSCQVVPGKEDFDYVEQVEQDNDTQKEKTVKKRGRKPIKARSLKSLM